LDTLLIDLLTDFAEKYSCAERCPTGSGSELGERQSQYHQGSGFRHQVIVRDDMIREMGCNELTMDEDRFDPTPEGIHPEDL